MTGKRQRFYKSREWESFLKQIKLERTNEEGYLMCEHCGQPIIKSYDCIGHHIIELTEENVDDNSIALNPDNVQLIHFRCHNELHQRFGFGVRIPKEVYLVWGSPCAGKTTWVNEVSDKNDIILDIDKLWMAVRSENCGDFEKPNALKNNVFALRDCLLDMIRVRRGNWQNAYVVGGYPLTSERERMLELLSAKSVYIEESKEICQLRAKEKNDDWVSFVNRWWEQYSPQGNLF